MTEDEWFIFFRGKSSWIYVNESVVHEFSRYFTYGKAYRLDYADFENKDVYLIDDHDRDWVPISYNELISNFECLEERRDEKLKELGI